MSKKFSKKAELALETLVSIILSFVILLVLFQFLISIFFVTPTNLGIAKDNAKSIVEFVSYSDNKYNDKNNCFTMLKLSNLENFQIESDDKQYFYIINSNGVYIYKKEYLSNILLNKEKLDEKIEYEEFYKFEENKIYDIRIENLGLLAEYLDFVKLVWVKGVGGTIGVLDFLNPFEEDGYSINNFFTGMGNLIDDIKISTYSFETDTSNYIILFPKYNKDFLGAELGGEMLGFNFGLSDNQNILLALNVERYPDNSFSDYKGLFNGVIFDSHYLVYEPSNKIFPSYSKNGETYINNNLCEYQNLIQKEIEKEKNTIINIYVNYDSKENVNDKFKFIWNDKKIQCLYYDELRKTYIENPVFSCQNYFKIDENKFENYLSFRAYIKFFFNNLPDTKTNEINFYEEKVEK